MGGWAFPTPTVNRPTCDFQRTEWHFVLRATKAFQHSDLTTPPRRMASSPGWRAQAKTRREDGCLHGDQHAQNQRPRQKRAERVMGYPKNRTRGESSTKSEALDRGSEAVARSKAVFPQVVLPTCKTTNLDADPSQKINLKKGPLGDSVG